MSVEFEVSPTLMEICLRLPAGYKVIGVRWDDTRYENGQVVFQVETDAAPEGAAWMSPHYSRVGTDAVVTGMTWYADDGTRTIEEFV